MRAKVMAVFIGKVENDFKTDKGETVEYKQVSVNIPGEMDSCVLSVPKDVDMNGLIPYQPCFLIVDFRFQAQYRTYRARVVKICKDADELAGTDAYFDNTETCGYLASMAAAYTSNRKNG